MTDDPRDSEAILYGNALAAAYPGSEFTILETGYDSLQWHDTTTPKPTWAEFDAAVAAYEAQKASK